MDEVGFGTKNLIHYAYGLRGEPLVFERAKHLRHNLTCTVTISKRKVEFLKFFSKGGTTNEFFEEYFEKLFQAMKLKYPDKVLVFILDNLKAHKSSLIMKIVNNEDTC